MMKIYTNDYNVSGCQMTLKDKITLLQILFSGLLVILTRNYGLKKLNISLP